MVLIQVLIPNDCRTLDRQQDMDQIEAVSGRCVAKSGAEDPLWNASLHSISFHPDRFGLIILHVVYRLLAFTCCTNCSESRLTCVEPFVSLLDPVPGIRVLPSQHRTSLMASVCP